MSHNDNGNESHGLLGTKATRTSTKTATTPTATATDSNISRKHITLDRQISIEMDQINSPRFFRINTKISRINSRTGSYTSSPITRRNTNSLISKNHTQSKPNLFHTGQASVSPGARMTSLKQSSVQTACSNASYSKLGLSRNTIASTPPTNQIAANEDVTACVTFYCNESDANESEDDILPPCVFRSKRSSVASNFSANEFDLGKSSNNMNKNNIGNNNNHMGRSESSAAGFNNNNNSKNRYIRQHSAASSVESNGNESNNNNNVNNNNIRKRMKRCVCNLFSRAKRIVKNKIAKHHYCYVLLYIVIYKILIMRLLTLWDIISDMMVAYELYDSQDSVWFASCCVFLVTPFLVTWSVSLRLIQTELIAKYEASYPKLMKLITFFLTFPMTGAILLLCFDIWSIFRDVGSVVKQLCSNHVHPFEIAFNSKYGKYSSYKKYRTTIEVIGEAFPQVKIQSYHFCVFLCLGSFSTGFFVILALFAVPFVF